MTPQIAFRKQIFQSLASARADAESRIDGHAKSRLLDRLDKAEQAANAGDAATFRYFWMAAQAVAQSLPPVKSAGIWTPGK